MRRNLYVFFLILNERVDVFLNRFFKKQNNLYLKMKELEQSLEFVRIQENYLRERDEEFET